MHGKILTCQRDGPIVTALITGPHHERESVISLAGALSDLCADIESDNEIRVLILTGSHQDSFVLAEDLLDDILGTSIGSEEFLGFARSVSGLDIPVIAVINGNAIGLGLELAVACDIRIASETSRFGIPHLRKGLLPWDGGTQRLPRLVGKAKALEMILTAEPIDAQEAYEMGLLNRIVPSAELGPASLEMARRIALNGPISNRYAKEAVNKGLDLTLEQGLRLEADLYYLLHTTHDRAEGVSAFREKRKARFTGS